MVLMDRSTVKTLARAMGGTVKRTEKSLICFQFSTEEATENFRNKIPFLTLWGGDGLPNNPPLNIYFDKLKI